MQQAIDPRYAIVDHYSGLSVSHEQAVRSAMQNLLSEAARPVGRAFDPFHELCRSALNPGVTAT